ncbi:MAG: HigA family addiction module antidote protein [Ignavibacteriales bacterium]|jgi:addiction module antidote protein, HigA family|nr:MAG: HigA family addiction module antidote protein [Ignavibacteriaceae bacterium]MBW7873672.1 HigA family addiction module antidote protein [Ignavibacteria bacterium]MCZ2143897.1 HigA family addiction module antidote protein [Ignavibacteriales bacterium]MBV6444576.1 hypothetical protein [Ignavibacteriaceae bacterium]MBZ0197527.1 HigA family addiction module antidote protein [Ignavibacteriaceae bacterium]
MINREYKYIPPVFYPPGETLSERLEELGISSETFAAQVNLPEEVVISVLKGDAPITPEIAEKLEKALKLPACFWLNMQKDYDEFQKKKNNQ